MKKKLDVNFFKKSFFSMDVKFLPKKLRPLKKIKYFSKSGIRPGWPGWPVEYLFKSSQFLDHGIENFYGRNFLGKNFTSIETIYF